MNTINVTDATFQTEVLESSVPVLVDFWAPWCAPCRMVAPILEEIAQEYHGRVKIAKLNTDENATAMQYQVMSIPTMMIFKNGEIVDQIVGAVPKQVIKEKLNYFAHDAETILN